jgi:two-component system CheB/CheR fusion protein
MLSGTGTDGTLGLRAIKEYGGMAMAQTLESAKYDAILRSAISTGLVDHVLPVEEMPAKLVDYAAHLASANGDGTLDSVRAQIAANMGKVHAILRRSSGHDFSQYKENTIARRLERRMKALQIETVEQYVQTLERKPEEADRLFNELLIGVTQFFRDREAFEALQAEVIPKLFEGKGEGDQVRACVMGCATGEEAYSVAILLLEHASTLDNAPKIQIFATDIDEGSLASARKGRYPESITDHVARERLERFFEKQEGAWQVSRELRDLVLFSSHSFLKDPPFSRLDLISCRNVMIYLGHELQRKLMPLFHYALRPGGYLFLGPSESAASHKELFGIVDKKHRIFERKETLPRPVLTFPLAEASQPKQPGARPLPEAEERDLSKRLERIILQRYRPACVTVKENGDAVYFSGRINDYLEQPTGSPDVNVVNMAREGLRIPLRMALQDCGDFCGDAPSNSLNILGIRWQRLVEFRLKTPVPTRARRAGSFGGGRKPFEENGCR